MFRKKWSGKPWYPYAVAGCITVIVFVILQNIGHVLGGVRTFLGYFIPVVIGLIIAYLMNQLSVFYQQKLFAWIKKEHTRNLAAITLSVLTVLGSVTGALVLLVPQLVDSVTTFANNLKSYEDSVKVFIQNWNFLSADATKRILDFLDSSGGILEYVTNYTVDHLSSILPAVANTGKSIITWVISFILAVYFLAGKQLLKNGLKRFLHALFLDENYVKVSYFLHRCNQITARFLVYNIIDAVIIGLVNALLMVIFRMPYIGLLSVVVGVTNLVPTFGPIVGGVIGALMLFLINPWHALIFIIFTAALQFCDGYILKPKLFGSTLNVPGLWILTAVIVFGRAMGVLGILLAIPAIAIIDFAYKEYFMPWLERRHNKRQAEENQTRLRENEKDAQTEAPAPENETAAIPDAPAPDSNPDSVSAGDSPDANTEAPSEKGENQ